MTHVSASPRASASVLVILITVALLLVGGVATAAIVPTVVLGTSANYSVLGGSTVTNTGNSVLNGGLGLSPGTSITGFPPGIVAGSIDTANGAAGQAQIDLTAAQCGRRRQGLERHHNCRTGQPGAGGRGVRRNEQGTSESHRQPDPGRGGRSQFGLHLSDGLDTYHRVRKLGHIDQRGPGMQRFLAGGQFGHPRDQFCVRWKHSGVAVDHGHHGSHGAWASTRTQRRRDP
jgi:hypothetical protein